MPVGTIRFNHPTRKWESVRVLSTVKPSSPSQFPDGFRVEIEIEFRKFHRLQRKWTPLLHAEQISKDRFQIQLVREFEDERPAGSHHVLDLLNAFGASAMWCRTRIIVAPSNNPSTKGRRYASAAT
jgi:hypothetical protein